MRILILSRGVPNSHDPQEGCFEFDQAKALKDAGHDVIVMAVDSRVRKYWRKIGIKKQIICDIPTYRLFLAPTSIIRHLISFPLGLAIETKEAIRLFQYIVKKEGNFDLIHAHYLTDIYYASNIKKKLNIPVVGTEHWSKVNVDKPNSNVTYMASSSYGNIDKLISVSESLRKRIQNNFNIDSTVIHNLIDTTHLLPLKENKSKYPFRIVLVGSLIPLKGFDFFIRSLAKSKIIDKDIEVKIIGGGSEHNKLQMLIDNLDLSSKITLLGQQPRKIIFEELNNANLFVLPSYSENFSVSVLEALANGLPVIATICGGIRECINDSNGILVKVGNEKEMSLALNQIYENYDKYNFQSIQQECLLKYSPQSIANLLTDQYNSILNQNKKNE